MKKRYLVMVGVAALIVGCTVSAAVRHNRGYRPFIDRLVSRMTRHLELTDAQQTQVKAILESERSTAAPLFAEAGRNRQQLREATASGKFNEAQVRALAARQAQTMTEMIVARERVKARIYNEVLTAEQRTRADEFFERMSRRFHGHLPEGAAAFAPIAP